MTAAIADVGMGPGYDRCSPLTCRWVGGDPGSLLWPESRQNRRPFTPAEVIRPENTEIAVFKT